MAAARRAVTEHGAVESVGGAARRPQRKRLWRPTAIHGLLGSVQQGEPGCGRAGVRTLMLITLPAYGGYTAEWLPCGIAAVQTPEARCVANISSITCAVFHKVACLHWW